MHLSCKRIKVFTIRINQEVVVASSSIRRGAVKTIEWWKHLRDRKRAQNKLVRKDGKAKARSSNEID
jgi:hypothetical protein